MIDYEMLYKIKKAQLSQVKSKGKRGQVAFQRTQSKNLRLQKS